MNNTFPTIIIRNGSAVAVESLQWIETPRGLYAEYYGSYYKVRGLVRRSYIEVN